MLIRPETLASFCRSVLEAAGLPPGDAAVVADVLVDANREGIDTHGVSRLPVYVSGLRRGRFSARPRVVRERTAPALGRMDGGGGMGALVAVRAMEFALELAGEAGIGFVAVRNSSHYGPASYYCKLAADRGMVGMALTNTPSGVPPWGGKSAYFGTNPIAFAFPGRDSEHVVVDLSTSIVARGHIIQAAREGRPIPEGWAVDRDGNPTTDAAAALDGAVLPMAGPKGYALALAVEILAGVLTGAAYGSHVGSMYDDGTAPVDVGHAFMAIRVSGLMGLETFQSRLEEMVREIKSVPLAPGHEAIHIPGERRRTLAARRKDGVPVSDAVLRELDGCAREAGLAELSVLARG
jgi:LDH2 family malate/lactate/ureidoglycolate dehydrogenase